MASTAFLRYGWRIAAILILILLLAFSIAVGQNTRNLRIGLETKQPLLGLQGNTPLYVTASGATVMRVPAEQSVTFAMAAEGITVTGPDGQIVVAASPVSIAAENTDAQIRLLGPGEHYDGKPDRPYRGTFEILATTDGLTAINIVDVEAYLLGVVSSEMRPDYPVEALKSQAIAARTYALKNIGRHKSLGYDLDDTQHCQVYGGVYSEDPRTTQAVQETAGMVLTYNGQLINAEYSSTCGGFTESAEASLGTDVPYLRGVTDNEGVTYPTTEAGWAAFFKSSPTTFCLQPEHAKYEAFRWVKLVTRQEVETVLAEQYQIGTVRKIVPLRRGVSGRVYALRIDGTAGSVTLEKENPIRRLFGGLRSTAFTIDTYADDAGTPVVFALWGAGFGHGRGMCQVGAVGLAERGWTAERILQHYYQDTQIERQY